MNTLFFQCGFIAFLYVTFLFIIAQTKKNNNVVDVGWAIGFIILSIYSLLFFSSFHYRQLLATLLVLIWGSRLSTHIYIRTRGKEEDPRYKLLKKRWGKYEPLMSYLEIFLFQGFLMIVIVSPVLIINSYCLGGLNLLDAFGLSIWLTGLFLESTADMQLFTFLSEPKNRGTILTTGLWRYSRHPNYFGEILIWVGMWLIALSVPYGWLSIISPLTIIGLFYFVSIPITERQFEQNEEFQRYKKLTSTLIPWPPTT